MHHQDQPLGHTRYIFQTIPIVEIGNMNFLLTKGAKCQGRTSENPCSDQSKTNMKVKQLAFFVFYHTHQPFYCKYAQPNQSQQKKLSILKTKLKTVTIY